MTSIDTNIITALLEAEDAHAEKPKMDCWQLQKRGN